MSDSLRALDVRIEREMFGRTVVACNAGADYLSDHGDGRGVIHCVPEYTHDVAAALTTVERLGGRSFILSCSLYADAGWGASVELPSGANVHASAAGPAEAICRMALAARARPQTHQDGQRGPKRGETSLSA